jgi:hypothetical protein
MAGFGCPPRINRKRVGCQRKRVGPAAGQRVVALPDEQEAFDYFATVLREQ